MDCKITALDANDDPIVGANITLDDSNKVTPLNGTVQVSSSKKENNILTVYHPDYVREIVHFSGTITNGEWDNALLEVRAGGRPSEAVLTIRLGRCIMAPTKEVTSEMTALAYRKGDIGAAIIEPFTDKSSRKTYRGHIHIDKPVEVAARVLLPKTNPPDDAGGWRRFETQLPVVPNDSETGKPLVEVSEEGRFLWLMYPHHSSKQQYAVLVWSPHIYSAKRIPSLDMILFYSPTTEQPTYNIPYPFGVQIAYNDKGPFPDQTYLSLGNKYLGEENAFYYQLVAQNRSAVLVMLICNYGDYGPTISGEGVFRLCREVSLLLHRERRTTNQSLASAKDAPDPNYTLAGISLRDNPYRLFSRLSSPPPPIGKVVTSFYSNSARPVKTLLENPYLLKDSRFPSRLWGVSDPEDLWIGIWRELWDMDGWHSKATAPWPDYLTVLQRWYSKHPERIFRLCHSSGRDPCNVDTDPHPFFKTLRKSIIKEDRRDIPQYPKTKEWHGDRWSVVSFADQYISFIPTRPVAHIQVPGIMPPKADAHQATPRVAFSHFLAMSDVGAYK